MDRLRRARYWVVLLLILVDVTVVSATSARSWAYLAIVAVRGVTLLACLSAARVAQAQMRLAVLVVAAAVAAVAASRIGAGTDPGIFARIVNGALVAVAPVVIARELWTHPSVTGQTVAGAVCIYLLLGLLFATAFGVVAAAAGDPLFRQGGDGTEASRLYFSFITLTSTGYGDFTPGVGPARALAVIEALLGQLYLVTVIAVLVGRVGPLRGREDER